MINAQDKEIYQGKPLGKLNSYHHQVNNLYSPPFTLMHNAVLDSDGCFHCFRWLVKSTLWMNSPFLLRILSTMEMGQTHFSGLARQQDLDHKDSSFPMKREELMCFYLISIRILPSSCQMARRSQTSSGYLSMI